MLTVDISLTVHFVCVFRRTMLTEHKSECVCVEGKYALPAADMCMLY